MAGLYVDINYICHVSHYVLILQAVSMRGRQGNQGESDQEPERGAPWPRRDGGQVEQGEEGVGRRPAEDGGGPPSCRGQSQPPQQGQGQAGTEPRRDGGRGRKGEKGED